MNTTPTADEFLLGGSAGKSAFGRDDAIGTTVTGKVVSTEVRQQTDISDGKPLTWDNGDPRMQLVVTIATDQHLDADDDGIRAIYVKGSKAPGSKSLHDAIRSAVQAANADGLKPGGTLTVQFAGTEPSATRGFNDRKLWAAQYVAPDPATASADFLGATPAPGVGGQPTAAPQPVSAPATQPTSTPATPPTAAQAGGDDTPAAKAKQLAALGLPADAIAAQLGLDPQVAAMLIAA